MNFAATLKPSKLLFFVYLFFYIGGLICILPLSFPFYIKLPIFIIIVLDLYWVLRKKVFLHAANSICKLEKISANLWCLHTNKEQDIIVELTDYYITRLFTMLNFKSSSEKFAVALVCDSVDKDELRRLRTLLFCCYPI